MPPDALDKTPLYQLNHNSNSLYQIQDRFINKKIHSKHKIRIHAILSTFLRGPLGHLFCIWRASQTGQFSTYVNHSFLWGSYWFYARFVFLTRHIGHMLQKQSVNGKLYEKIRSNLERYPVQNITKWVKSTLQQAADCAESDFCKFGFETNWISLTEGLKFNSFIKIINSDLGWVNKGRSRDIINEHCWIALLIVQTFRLWNHWPWSFDK